MVSPMARRRSPETGPEGRTHADPDIGELDGTSRRHRPIGQLRFRFQMIGKVGDGVQDGYRDAAALFKLMRCLEVTKGAYIS